MPSANVIASIMRVLGHASAFKNEGIPYLHRFGHAADTLDNLDAQRDELLDTMLGGAHMNRLGLPSNDKGLSDKRWEVTKKVRRRVALEKVAPNVRRRIIARQAASSIDEEDRMAAIAEFRAMQRENLMRKSGLGKQLDKEYDDLVTWFKGMQRNQKVQERLQSLSRDSSNTESGLNKLMYRIHRNKK